MNEVYSFLVEVLIRDMRMGNPRTVMRRWVDEHTVSFDIGVTGITAGHELRVTKELCTIDRVGVDIPDHLRKKLWVNGMVYSAEGTWSPYKELLKDTLSIWVSNKPRLVSGLNRRFPLSGGTLLYEDHLQYRDSCGKSRRAHLPPKICKALFDFFLGDYLDVDNQILLVEKIGV